MTPLGRVVLATSVRAAALGTAVALVAGAAGAVVWAQAATLARASTETVKGSRRMVVVAGLDTRRLFPGSPTRPELPLSRLVGHRTAQAADRLQQHVRLQRLGQVQVEAGVQRL